MLTSAEHREWRGMQKIMIRSEISAFAHLEEFHALLMFDCPVEISEGLLDCDHRRGEEMKQQYEMMNCGTR